MIIVFYSINDTLVNTVDLQLNTCHFLSPVWSHYNKPTDLCHSVAFPTVPPLRL